MVIIISIIFISILIRYFLFYRGNTLIGKYLKEGPYGDASTYFFLIQFFRKNNCGVSDKRCLLGNDNVFYPSFFLKNISIFFSDKTLFKFSWAPNFIIYFLGLVFFVSILIIYGFQKIEIVGILLLFFLQTDNLLYDKDRIHFLSLSPRFLGVICNSFLFLIYVIFDQSIISFTLLVIMSFVSINNSLFGRQNTFFTILIITIISHDFYLISAFLLSFILSVIIYPREFYPSLKLQIRFLSSYFKRYYKASKTGFFLRDLVAKIFSRTFFESYPYYSFFFVTIFYLVYFKNIELFFEEDFFEAKKLTYIYLSVLIIFFITGLRKFAFLGECWRYISFSTYFLNPIFLYKSLFLIIESKLLFWAVLLLISFIQILLFKFLKIYPNKNKSLLSLLNSKKDQFKNAIWYAVPHRSTTLLVSLGFGLKTFEFQYGNFTGEIIKKYFSVTPFLKWNQEIILQNKITHVLVEKEYLKSATKYSNFNTEGLKLISENEYYYIYKFK